MKKVFKIMLDSFKPSYKGYWSSVQKAIEELPNNSQFKNVVSWNYPGSYKEGEIYKSNDYDFNSKLKIVLKSDNGILLVYIPGFKRLITQTINVPEVKLEGQPYVPSKTIHKDLGIEFINDVICRGYVEEIELDKVED